MRKKFWFTVLVFTGFTAVVWAQPGSNKAGREKQVNSILETQQLNLKRHQEQPGRKELKNIVLKNQAKEKIVLDAQRKEKDAALSELTRQRKDLKKQIASKKKRDKKLKKSFRAIVRKDIENDKKKKAKRTAAKKERNKIPATGSLKKPVTLTPDVTIAVKKQASYPELNEKDEVLGTDFTKSCGNLPWPVDNGFISTGFGFYIIDGTTIKGNNPGITIATTSAGVSVKAVFEGEVSEVDSRGDVGTIFIRHGKYYTVYSNLSSINVTKGAIIKGGQVIGRAGEADEGRGGQLDFMLMIESKNVNPELWLRR